MTRVQFLNDLKLFCEDAVKDMVFPLQVQKGDIKEQKRAPIVYIMRLPNSKSYEKYAHYIIVQIVKGNHIQKAGQESFHTVKVRLVFCVYCENEQDGAIMLMNVMDRVQEKLMESRVVGGVFKLNCHEPFETQSYYEDTAPFFGGEMTGTFIIPATERKVDFDELF